MRVVAAVTTLFAVAVFLTACTPEDKTTPAVSQQKADSTAAAGHDQCTPQPEAETDLPKAEPVAEQNPAEEPAESTADAEADKPAAEEPSEASAEQESEQPATDPAMPPELQTELAKVSYVLGMDIANRLKSLDTDIDLDLFYRGMRDKYADKDVLLTDEQASKIQQDFFTRLQAEQARKRRELADKNKKEGDEFLAANKEKEGVKTTDSGLQYMVLTEGDGPTPTVSHRVKVHYRGTLIDGTEFDSSYTRDEPSTIGLRGVIKGWTEGLQLMNVGSKYRFFVPSDLAYGPRGSRNNIGPNATLMFEIELLEILPPATQPARRPAPRRPTTPRAAQPKAVQPAEESAAEPGDEATE
ncbi:MAG TPA: FKBP-type peptidyl-prolyl cis-trans isomerase N-terminal domain-containing protein [Phycisphaerae bacterium]|nr:FKBP-type peptidyl-prolyl cis-trans isomerase N-terminal domain-containing protein [Phycisphaerae bacterium]